MKSSKGRVCGGFASVSWNSSKAREIIRDDKAFWFSVDLKKKYECCNKYEAITTGADIGPVFGRGVLSIGYYGEPMNQENKSVSGI